MTPSKWIDAPFGVPSARYDTLPDPSVLENELVGLLGEHIRRYFPANPSDHSLGWVGQVLYEQLSLAVQNGDPVAIAMACDLIDKDPKLPFGKIIKSRLARRLRQVAHLLEAVDREKVVNTTLRLLTLPHAPRELEDYAKLLTKLPVQEYAEKLAGIQTQNEKSARILRLLLENTSNRPTTP